MLALGMVRCGGPPPPASAPGPVPGTARPEPPIRTRAAPLTGATFGPGPTRWVRSNQLQAKFLLPDRPGWATHDEPSRFVLLTHASTTSTLLVGRWREAERMSRSRCEERARLWRELPTREGRELARRTLEVPRAFDTELWTGVVTRGAEAEGRLLAFGGRGRDCFAFVFTTTEHGPQAEDRAGDRLAAVTAQILERLELVGDGAVDVPRE